MDALLIRVRFTAGVYRGGDLARPEPLPSAARLHAAFLSAAAGGPQAEPVNGELAARAGAEAAVRWLEQHEPVGVLAPGTRVTDYVARRHRIRAAMDDKRGDHHREETPFEPFSALDGPIVFAWPVPPKGIHATLKELASEITHVGRADSTVVVAVTEANLDEGAAGMLVSAAGRGAGLELRVPRAGRTASLVDAHRRARAQAPHTAGKKGKQAPDEGVESAEEAATSLVRFAVPRATGAWPFAEIWRVPAAPGWPGWAMRPGQRVASAVAVHRALVAAIGEDVPSFVAGRDSSGPLAGGGHLAVQFSGSPAELLLGIPVGVSEADRAALVEALSGRPRVRVGRQHMVLDLPRISSAVTFWPEPADRFATSVPLVLDTPGTPRHAPWTFADGVLCSLGYALRGPLEKAGVEWGTGWAFRRELVGLMRERGAKAHAFRVASSASRFLHRARDGDLAVALHAVVELGELAGERRGFLALGRSRHLGGGLLQPLAGSLA